MLSAPITLPTLRPSSLHARRAGEDSRTVGLCKRWLGFGPAPRHPPGQDARGHGECCRESTYGLLRGRTAALDLTERFPRNVPLARPVRPGSDRRQFGTGCWHVCFSGPACLPSAAPTRMQCRLRWHLHELLPGLELRHGSLRQQQVLTGLEARLADLEGVVARIARELPVRCSEFTALFTTTRSPRGNWTWLCAVQPGAPWPHLRVTRRRTTRPSRHEGMLFTA
jgi:hypothetical protein